MAIEKNAQNICFHGNQYAAMATKKRGFLKTKNVLTAQIFLIYQSEPGREVGDGHRKMHKISVSMVTNMLPWQPKKKSFWRQKLPYSLHNSMTKALL